jgi:hypothetical protein
MNNVVVYDNNTGRDLPTKIDVYNVDVLLGNTISQVIDSIENNVKLFIVFTHLQNLDFVVYSNEDKEYLEELLSFGKYNYKVDKKDNSPWYTNKAEKCVIVSDSVTMDNKELSNLLSLFIIKSNNTIQQKEIYIVSNYRNRKALLKTPIYDEAVKRCDKEPCGVIVRRSDSVIIYRSKFGKVAIPYNKEDVERKPRKTVVRNANRARFNINI